MGGNKIPVYVPRNKFGFKERLLEVTLGHASLVFEGLWRQQTKVITGGSWIGELADTMVRTPKAYGMDYQARNQMQQALSTLSGCAVGHSAGLAYCLEYRLIAIFEPS